MNSVLMTTYVAGTILSQATFGSMTECLSARDTAMEHNEGIELVVCSYVSSREQQRQREFDSFWAKFQEILRTLRDMEEENRPTGLWQEDQEKCGVLGVEPNEWIRTNRYNESSSYEPITGDGRRCG